jgi:DNA-damage-inducible protein J
MVEKIFIICSLDIFQDRLQNIMILTTCIIVDTMCTLYYGGVIFLGQTTLNVRIDEQLKKELEMFCNDVGMNISVAVNLFAKTVVREQRLPFEIALDPFYSKSNQERLLRSIAQMESTGGTVHELPKVDEND